MSEGKSKPWPRVATINKKVADDGSVKGYFLVADADITLKKGEFLHVEKPRDTVDRLLKIGRITEHEAEVRLERLPKKVVFNISLPPKR